MATRVQGSLAFSVDGPGGRAAGTVEGRGPQVTVRADDPVAAWDAALGSVSTGPAVLDTVGRLLSDEGVTVEVVGPRGTIATVGAGVDDRLGKVLAGSRYVRLGKPAAIRPLAVAEARRRASETRTLVLGGVLALVLAALLGRRGRP